MKLKKEMIIFVILVLSMLIISGCANLPQVPNLPSLPVLGGKEKTITQSRALSITFLKNQPPLNKIEAGAEFPITIKLSNNAPQEISGTIELSDSPGDQFSSLSGIQQYSFSLPSAEEVNGKLIPSEEIINLGSFEYFKQQVFEGMTTTFTLVVKTQHNDIVTSQICMKSGDVTGIRCPDDEIITNFGKLANFAPVKVSKIEKSILPKGQDLSSMLIKVFLANSGKGEVDTPDQIISNFNVNLHGNNLICSGNKLSLKYGQKEIVCTADIDAFDEVFKQELLEVSYSYPYKIIESIGPIKVEKPEIEKF